MSFVHAVPCNTWFVITTNDNLFGGQGNSKRRCRYMHFNKSSLVPHPEETIVC